MCGMIGATLGGVKNISGIFFAPIAESFGVGRGAVSMSLTISNLMLALGGFIAPSAFSRSNFRKLSRLLALSVICMTLLIGAAPNLALLYILSGIRGFSLGMLGIVTGNIILNNWFVKYNSFVTGVMLAAGGVISAVLSPIISRVMDNSGWRAGCLVDAAIIFLLLSPLLFLPIALCPEDIGMKSFGCEASEESHSEDTKLQAVETSAETIPLVALLLFSAFANILSTFPNHLPSLADSYALSTSTGAAMLSACMLSNASGKILMGVAAERFGVKRPAILYSALIAAGLLTLMHTRAAFGAVLSGAAIGLSFSLTTVVSALVTKDIFGTERYRVVFPLSNLAGTVANASAASIIGYIYDTAGSYYPAIIVLIVLLCGIVILLLVLYDIKIRFYSSSK